MNINEVFTIKLSSGEELIAKIKDIQTDYIIIEQPLSVAPGPQGMGLIPSMFTLEPHHDVRLNTHMITLSGPTEENIKLKYLEATTGIAVPSKKLLIG